MRNQLKIYLWIIFFISFVSCQDSKYRQINYTLDLAGDNRFQLEQVLNHYSQNRADSLKLRAAEFLIIYMPGHYSYIGPNFNTYCKKAEEIIFTENNIEKRVEKLNKLNRLYPLSSFQKIEDCKIITSEFLIKNIDRAFDDWQKGMWAKGITFEEFCEYLLPYKCAEGQCLDTWRETLCMMVNDTLRDFKYNDIWSRTAFQAAEAANIYMAKKVIVNLKESLKSHTLYKEPLWGHIPSNSCETRTTTAQAIFRSAGFPVAYDFILQWATGNNSHAWLNLRIDSNRGIPCEGGHESLLAEIRPGECKGKIYRRTYAPNPEIIKLLNESKYVPIDLCNIFMRDVTKEYVTTVDITFEVLSDKCLEEEKYAYLAVFCQGKWRPICFTKIDNKQRITFRGMEKGAVYLPVYYTKKGVKAFNFPALLDERGKLHILKPQSSMQVISLKRKYPLFRKAFNTAKRLRGAMLQASKRIDFADAVTLHTFYKYSVAGYVEIKDTTKYRYWRYLSPQPYRCNIAELGFYDEHDTLLVGKVIGSEERSTNPRYKREAAFDGDPLTFFASKNIKYGWVGMDFGVSKHVSKVGYMIRNDDNNIRVGDFYELLYWGKSGWISLGRKKAKELILTYDNVPTNALFWLRNLTRGNDERIFLYSNGKQIWY